ncbi:hypothetical protein [Cognatiyoonia sp. IB215182]|uniref:hypothetical protein n=1 Tax=Cognatiyoonia sp. IB215182 TaxID=3097353 RepID=UPI002A16D139|nr:hypothetical protein [Cognatiyoonia sp. IB215182]MDX8355260.1 hypothetical protein [Cognatiyoonia sp. IB215182]
MGLLVLSGERDVAFPRRLFAALVNHEIYEGRNTEHWHSIKCRFEGGGAFLDVSELTDEELIAFRDGVENLILEINGQSSFAGFDVKSIEESLMIVRNHFQN